MHLNRRHTFIHCDQIGNVRTRLFSFCLLFALGWTLFVDDHVHGFAQDLLPTATTPQIQQLENPQSKSDVRDENRAKQTLGDLLEGLDLQGPEESVPTIPDASRSADPGESTTGSGGQDAGEIGSAKAISTLVAAFQSMQKAEQLLARGQTDSSVVEAQQKAVDLLDQLIEAQRQNSDANQQSQQSKQDQQNQQQQQQNSQSSSSANPLEDPEQGETGRDQQESQLNGNSQDRDGSSREGEPEEQERSTPATAAAAPLNASAQGIWGHLPQKTRGMLRADIPTDYLPSYSKQISEYFKALAELPSDR